MKNTPKSLEVLLEEIRAVYDYRKFVHPDPLEFLYAHEDIADREVVALIASSLAYGKVNQILKSVSDILERVGEKPARFVYDTSKSHMEVIFNSFRHRFTSGADMTKLLTSAGVVLRKYGSLNRCFVAKVGRCDRTVLPALSHFVEEMRGKVNMPKGLLPCPEAGSACKRLHLFLRWMVRCDEIDPGGWSGIDPSMLVVPLDTHMHRLSSMMGLTQRHAADGKAALEITSRFADIAPDDPVKYDFSLTRLGIRNDAKGIKFLPMLRQFAR